MTPRIPSSLKWLINKRARIAGEITKLEENQARTCAAIAKLQADLASLDRVFSIHEIAINPECVRPIRPKEIRTSLSYGELTRVILNCMQEAKEEPISTNELAPVNSLRNLTPFAGVFAPR